MIRVRCLAWTFLIALAGAAAPVSAQIIQLPSVHTFSSSGSVLVPDSGGAYLGGRNFSASRSMSRPGNRTLDRRAGAGGTSVHVTIIDLDALDRDILGSDPNQLRQKHSRVEPSEEGKQLVRFARSQLKSGNQGAAFDAYRMAVAILPGELRGLAVAEMRRAFPLGVVQVATSR